MSKGERTRATILTEAVAVSSTDGLAGLTIGSLAERLGMSKSGLFAHFGSKEQLQQAALEYAADLFIATVLQPAMAAPRGLPRLEAVFENWMRWGRESPLPGGCPVQAACYEFDDKPGPVRDHVVGTELRLHDFLARTVRLCIEAGHFRGDVDADQLAFEIRGLVVNFALTRRLMGQPGAETWARAGFRRLVETARPQP
jgi:AcrR family transcriptional regulator